MPHREGEKLEVASESVMQEMTNHIWASNGELPYVHHLVVDHSCSRQVFDGGDSDD